MDENVIHLLKVLEVALIASLKFLIAPFEAERYGFDFKEAFGITTAGGIFGIIVFTFIGDGIAFIWKKIKNFFRKSVKKDERLLKRFKWSTRFIIKTKMRFGLMGVALITPSIISIPIGTFVIHRIYRGKLKNMIILFASLLIWSAALNGLAQYLRLSQYLHLPK
ncbi:MAG: hypothetical protein HY841_00070 [Bacteroidetes bacterium]|nr:hypothetical protein [Bacteroidota bacterium]